MTTTRGTTTLEPPVSVEDEDMEFEDMSRIIQVFRIARIMRIFKLARSSSGLQVRTTNYSSTKNINALNLNFNYFFYREINKFLRALLPSPVSGDGAQCSIYHHLQFIVHTMKTCFKALSVFFICGGCCSSIIVPVRHL